MAARFLFIQLPTLAAVDANKIKPVLDLALDWIEVSPNSWVVWTTSSAEKWYGRIAKRFGEKTRIFVIRIDPADRHGWMPKSFWEFFKGKQGK